VSVALVLYQTELLALVVNGFTVSIGFGASKASHRQGPCTRESLVAAGNL